MMSLAFRHLLTATFTLMVVVGACSWGAEAPEKKASAKKPQTAQKKEAAAKPEKAAKDTVVLNQETALQTVTTAKFDLGTILKGTLNNNGEIQESVQDIEIARQQLERARAALYPRGEAMLLAAPIFEERGNALNSESNWGKWGPFLKGGITLVQPLYTFGQISSYKEAARNQIDANTELAKMKKNEIIFKAKELYFGYLMASEFVILVDDMVSFLAEAVEEADKGLKKKKSSVRPHDVYHLKTELEDLRQKGLYAQQAKKTAARAVAWISGLQFDSIPKKKLKPQPFEMKTLDQYIEVARRHRPEYRALKAGQAARLALRDAKRAQSYPVFFVGGYASYGWSPVRDKQNSVFASDPFNSFEGGIGFGLKLDLEFKRHAAEAAEQEAEYLKLKAKETYAVPGIQLQVKKAFWEMEQAVASLEVAKRRKKTARKWFISSAMGWSIGLTPAKDLMEALEGNGKARQNYIETVYFYNLTLANLTAAIGTEATTIKY